MKMHKVNLFGGRMAIMKAISILQVAAIAATCSAADFHWTGAGDRKST